MRRAPTPPPSRRRGRCCRYLLRYPRRTVVAARARARGRGRRAAGGPGARGARALPGRLERRSDALAARYVETFDLRRRASLYLTYYAHGDTRERGMALLRLKKLYRAAGLPMDSRRAARPPDGHARVRGARAAPGTARRCWPSTGRRSSCCGSRCTTSRARTRTCSTRSRRCCRALSVSRARARSRGSRARGRRTRRSASSRTGRRRRCRPEARA